METNSFAIKYSYVFLIMEHLFFWGRLKFDEIDMSFSAPVFTITAMMPFTANIIS